jgi:hypothetical protein
LVNHPENLPKKEIAKVTSFWFENIKADYYWLKTVQYIWWNAFRSEYKRYLYLILDLITELNPYFEFPYIIWQLLLPAYEPNYEFIDKEEQEIHTEEAVQIWLKWIKNFCDIKKLELIENEGDLLKIWNNVEYKNPCRSYKVPFYLAYIYWFYKNDPLESAKYYKIASANEDSPSWAKTMAAIMPWKWWNREKSFFMFLTLANFLEPNNEICNVFVNKLNEIWNKIWYVKEIELNWELVKGINNLRSETFSFDETIIKDTKCENYINKAVRELNLAYIDLADAKFQLDKQTHSLDAKELYYEWYMDYLPVDFQQYKDYGIIYIYNENVGNYDYKMGTYSN